jgi:SAM-dependent methyltransferase
MEKSDLGNMGMIDEGHLGGFFIDKDPATFMPHLWQHICFDLNIKSVLDVGCGMGHAIGEFSKHCDDVLGIEGSQFVYHNSPFKKSIKFHDFTEGLVEVGRSYDLCWSCEFVEHVEEEYRDNFLDVFSKCKYIAITYAEPGQDGHHHVNCQPKEYWIEHLGRYGLKYDEDITEKLKKITYKDAVEINSTYMDNHFYNRGLFFINTKMIGE